MKGLKLSGAPGGKGIEDLRRWVQATLVLGMCFGWAFDLRAQGQGEVLADRIEGTIAQWVEDGWLTGLEGEALLSHLTQTGWPRALAEAHAVPGLSPAAAARLEQEPGWARWVALATSPAAASRFRMSWVMEGVMEPMEGAQQGSWAGPPWGLSWRLGRSRVWSLRLDRGAGEQGLDHVAGYVTLRPRSWQMLLGDHSIRWGQGLVGWSSSAFDGVRDPTVVHAMTRWVVPMAAGDGLLGRRGLALWRETGRWQWALSASAPKRELRWEGGEPAAWYREGWHRTEVERNRESVRVPRVAVAVASPLWRSRMKMGGAMEWGQVGWGSAQAWGEGVVGSVWAQGMRHAWRWGGEICAFEGGWRGRAGLLLSEGEQRDYFVRCWAGAGMHPALRWGEAEAPDPGTECLAGFLWKHPGKRMGRFWLRGGWEQGASTWEAEWRRKFRPEKLLKTGSGEWRVLVKGLGGASSAGLQVLGEGTWEHREGMRVKVWAQGELGGGHWDEDLSWGRGGGVVLGWHPPEGAWDVDGLLWIHELEPGMVWYRLQPEALRWSSTVLTGEAVRWGCCVRRELGKKGEISVSGSRIERSAVRWQGSDATRTQGAQRHTWQVHFAFAL